MEGEKRNQIIGSSTSTQSSDAGVKLESMKTELKDEIKEPKSVPKKTEKSAKVIRSGSYFDGGVLGLIGWRILAALLTVVTLGIGAPWAKCLLYSYQFKHTVYNGKRLKFEGTGGNLFLYRLKWLLLSIVTLGIYTLFLPVSKAKWVVSHLHYEDEEYVKSDSYFEGNTLQLFGLMILSWFLVVLSLGLLTPYVDCLRLRWLNKHSVINKKKLVFTGKAINLWGKYLLWIFLTIITLGIFTLWLPIVELKWQTKNVHIKTADEKEPSIGKSLLAVIPIIIIGMVLYGVLVANYNVINSNIDVNMIEQKVRSVVPDMELGDVFGMITRGQSNEEVIMVAENKIESKTEKPVDSSFIRIGGYKVSLGTYTGEDSLYDLVEQKAIPVHIKVIIHSGSSITLDGKKQNFTVSGNKILVNGTQVIEVTGDNQLVYLAQSCPTLTYQGK